MSHARVLWAHFLRFLLILRKDSLTRHARTHALSLPVCSHRVRTGSDNASDKRQNCRLLCRVKLSFRKINGDRRKCTHRTRATSDKIFQVTSDKILNFYNFMRALLRQATILSLVAPCAFTPLELDFLVISLLTSNYMSIIEPNEIMKIILNDVYPFGSRVLLSIDF